RVGKDCRRSEGAPLEDSGGESEEDRARRRKLSPVTTVRIGTKDWRCRVFHGRSMVSLTEHAEARECWSGCCFLWNVSYRFFQGGGFISRTFCARGRVGTYW